MSLFKRVSLLLLLVPLFFALFSFVTVQKSHAATRTLKFTGYVFVDNGAGSGTANNGKKDGSEPYYTNSYTVQAGGSGSTKNGNNYSVSTLTTSSSVTVKLLVPSGYESTKLNYTAGIVGGNIITAVADGNLKTFTTGNTVNFGIKALLPYCDDNNSTNCRKCTSSSQCSSKATFKICGINSANGICVQCNNNSQCASGKICADHSCVNSAPTIRVTSFWDTNGNAVYDKGNQNVPGPDSCLSPISVQVVHSGITTTKNTFCTGTGEALFNTDNASINSVVKTGTSSKFIITGIWLKDDNHINGIAIKNVTSLSVVGTATVYFGLKQKPFCDDNNSSNCQKCTSDPQCSSKATFKHCGIGSADGTCVQCNNNSQCASGKICADHSCVNSAPTTKTLRFTGYVFVDDGAGNGTAGNGMKDGSEAYTNKSYTIEADNSNVNFTKNGNNYAISKTTTAGSEVEVRLLVPSGYVTTKLNYQLSAGSDTSTHTAIGASKKLGNSGRVNFGIKPNTSACTPKKATITVDKDKDGKPGKPVVWNVTLKNADEGSNCPSRTVAVTREFSSTNHNGWSASLDKNSVSLSKGDSKTVTLTVKSPDSANPGNSRTIVISAKTNTLTSTQNVTYHVISGTTPTNTPTRRPTNAPTHRPTVSPTSNPITCNPTKPQLNITADKSSVKPGGKITYTIKVKNVDQGPCAKRSLSLARTYPPSSNLTGAFQPSNTFDIAKGVEKTFTLPVTSPNNTSVGTKKVTIDLKNAGGTVIHTKDVDFIISETTITPTNTPTPTPEEPTPTSEPLTPTPTGGFCNARCNSDTQCASGYTCYQPPMPTCPAGVFCTQVMPAKECRKTTCQVSADCSCDETPTPTISQTPPGQTLLNMSIGLDGIGVTPRIPIGGNKNPIDNTLFITTALFNASTNEKLGGSDIGNSFTYSPNTSRFEGSFTLNNDSFETGIYNIYTRSPQSLFAQLTGSITITKGQTTAVPVINLITGNITDQNESENRIDLIDWNVLNSCWIYSSDRLACDQDPTYIQHADLNDDGIVNEDDSTLFIKEFVNHEGIALPEQ